MGTEIGNTGGIKEINITKEDRKRWESEDTESTAVFKRAFREWKNTNKFSNTNFKQKSSGFYSSDQGVERTDKKYHSSNTERDLKKTVSSKDRLSLKKAHVIVKNWFKSLWHYLQL